MSGGLQLMTITGYTDEEFQNSFEGDPYTMMINPDSIKWDRANEYNEQQPPDSSAPAQKYKSTPSEKLSFDVVIDCTGIVDPSRANLSNEISALEKIVYTYNGSIHRPNFVKVQWGKDIIFKGVLTTFNTSYTFFRPDGSPLRAKVSLAFTQYISPSTVKKIDNQCSPDISHLVTVQEGITLPDLCREVWNDDSYYIQAARYNGLDKFRNLKGITQLIFPPIIQPV